MKAGSFAVNRTNLDKLKNLINDRIAWCFLNLKLNTERSLSRIIPMEWLSLCNFNALIRREILRFDQIFVTFEKIK